MLQRQAQIYSALLTFWLCLSGNINRGFSSVAWEKKAPGWRSIFSTLTEIPWLDFSPPFLASVWPFTFSYSHRVFICILGLKGEKGYGRAPTIYSHQRAILISSPCKPCKQNTGLFSCQQLLPAHAYQHRCTWAMQILLIFLEKV